MYRLLAFRRLFSCLTLFVMLGAALAPGISHALNGKSNTQGWLEVCTAQGVKLVPGDSKAPHPAPTSAIHLEHCAFCVPHADTLALPPSPIQVFAQPEAIPALYPPLFYTAPRPLFIWSATQPRAPPVVSA